MEFAPRGRFRVPLAPRRWRARARRLIVGVESPDEVVGLDAGLLPEGSA
jgi:hypothetical protein